MPGDSSLLFLADVFLTSVMSRLRPIIKRYQGLFNTQKPRSPVERKQKKDLPLFRGLNEIPLGLFTYARSLRTVSVMVSGKYTPFFAVS